MNTRRSGRRVRGASSAGSSSDLDGTRSGDRVLHGSNWGTVAPGHLAEVKRDNPPTTGGQGDDNPEGTVALLQRLLAAQEQRAVGVRGGAMLERVSGLFIYMLRKV